MPRVALAPWPEANSPERGAAAACLSKPCAADAGWREGVTENIEEDVDAHGEFRASSPKQSRSPGANPRPATGFIEEEVKEVLAARRAVHDEDAALDPHAVVDRVCAMYGFQLAELHDLMPERPTRLGLPAIPVPASAEPAIPVPASTEEQRGTAPSHPAHDRPRAPKGRASSHTPSKNRWTHNHTEAAQQGGMRPMDAPSRIKERKRLERDIQSLKSDVKKKRVPAQNESLRLAHVLGALSRSSANALDKVRNPEQLHKQFMANALAPNPPPVMQERSRRPGGTTRVHEQHSLRRRSASADPDSPSRRKDPGFLGSTQEGRGRPPLPRGILPKWGDDDQPQTASSAPGSRSPSPRVYRPPAGRRKIVARPCSGERFSKLGPAYPRPPLPPPQARGLVAKGDASQGSALETAVRKLQSWARLWRVRSSYKTVRKGQLSALRMVAKFKSSLQSERNSLWYSLCSGYAKDQVMGVFLAHEGEESERQLAALHRREAEQAACEEALAAARLDRILEDEAIAEREKDEALAAEEKLKKEEAEALDWRARAASLQAETDSFRIAIEAKGSAATKRELQLLKNKLTLCERTCARAGREYDQFEFALKMWVKERDEAIAAVDFARSERKQWDEEKDQRYEDRDARERNRHDMPFRDARKSVLQKLRASNLNPADPTSVLHPALPIAFFAKIEHMKTLRNCSGEGAFVTPRQETEAPNKGVAVVLASDYSRYEGDWHQMRAPGEAVLKQAFDTAYHTDLLHSHSRSSRLTAGIAAPNSPKSAAAAAATAAAVAADNSTALSSVQSRTSPSSLRTPRMESIDKVGFQKAMLKIGWLLTTREAESLVFYFDQNGNGTVDFDEFQRGVARLVGSGCPHGSG